MGRKLGSIGTLPPASSRKLFSISVCRVVRKFFRVGEERIAQLSQTAGWAYKVWKYALTAGGGILTWPRYAANEATTTVSTAGAQAVKPPG